MARLPLRVGSQSEAQFDEIIDVRSESEYALDHIPGAINLPVLNDLERIEVGTLYKQTSSFEAKKRGAALVAANISRHLESFFAKKPAGYRPLVYCWRGGQRSESLALVLAQVGWDATLLVGGYKRFRKRVVEFLNDDLSSYRFQVISGLTGTGKTFFLRELARSGEQVLDLEELACHRGSLLGLEPGSEQPSQKAFDTSLFDALRRFDRSRPIWVESESFRIGRLELPKPLWEVIRTSKNVEIRVPLEARVAYLLEAYKHFLAQPSQLSEKLQMLTPLHGKERIAEWLALLAEEKWHALVSRLLSEHYDKSYTVALSRNFNGKRETVELTEVSTAAFQSLRSKLFSYG